MRPDGVEKVVHRRSCAMGAADPMGFVDGLSPPVSPPMMEPPMPKKAEAANAPTVSAFKSTETPFKPNSSSSSNSAKSTLVSKFAESERLATDLFSEYVSTRFEIRP